MPNTLNLPATDRLTLHESDAFHNRHGRAPAEHEAAALVTSRPALTSTALRAKAATIRRRAASTLLALPNMLSRRDTLPEGMERDRLTRDIAVCQRYVDAAEERAAGKEAEADALEPISFLEAAE